LIGKDCLGKVARIRLRKLFKKGANESEGKKLFILHKFHKRILDVLKHVYWLAVGSIDLGGNNLLTRINVRPCKHIALCFLL